MGQYLKTAIKKDRNKSKGSATRTSTKNNLSLRDVFMSVFFNKRVNNGKSKNKN